MIDFACKKFDLGEVIKCSLGLTKSEFRIVEHLMKMGGEFRSDELSSFLGLDKSTIQRSLKSLHQKGILFRGQENKAGGGYVYFYRLKDKEDLRQKIISIIHNWVSVFDEKIEKW